MRTSALSLTVSAVTALVLTASVSTSALAAELGSPDDPTTPASPSDSAPDPAATSAPDQSTGPAAPSQQAGGTALKTQSAQPGDVTSIDLESDEVTILGARWSGEDPQLEFRSQRSGTWTDWQELGVEDEGGPDEGSAEAKQATASPAESEAVPVLDSTKLEVRSTDGSAATKDLKITTVSTPVTAADKAITPPPAPDPADGLSPQIYDQGLKANIVTRKEWGADESLVRCRSDQTSSAKGVFLHHTAGSNSYTQAQAPGIIRGYLTYHTQSRGWCDIGYNFLVDRFGTIYEGRAGSIDKAITGAHASGFNSYTIGVAVLGTYNSSAPSSAAQRAVERVVAWKANMFAFSPTGSMTLTSGGGGTSKYPEGRKVTLKTVSGHRDTSYTDCPGTAFYNRLGAIRTAAGQLQSSLGYVTKGAIGAYYREHRAETGEPTGVERPLTNPDGAYQHFAKGTVYWSQATGAHLNKGGIRTAYAALGYEKGKLGFPTSDEVTFKYRTSAVYQTFRNGMITYSSTTKGQPLSGGFLTKWKALGWERSSLGLPTSGEFSSGGKTHQNFEKGYMTFTSREGVRVFAG
ncbi:N-acetylmuramoyl-L-alanine amidase [Brevibacterium casei]